MEYLITTTERQKKRDRERQREREKKTEGSRKGCAADFHLDS